MMRRTKEAIESSRPKIKDTTGFKVVPCGKDMLRYVVDDKGRIWYAATDVMQLVQITRKSQWYALFDESELAEVLFVPGHTERVVAVQCVSQSGLLKVILKSDLEVFKPRLTATIKLSKIIA